MPPAARHLLVPVAAVAAIAAAGAAGAPADAQAPEQISTAAVVPTPSDVAPLPDGGLLAIDTSGGRAVRIDAPGAVTTLATGFAQPRGIAPLADGGFLVADTGNHRIVWVAPDGTAVTIVGATRVGTTAAVTAPLLRPGGVAALPGGAFLVADTGHHRILRVSAGGEITTVAGTGTAGLGGDGGPATSAMLDSPARVVALPDGGFLVADTGNDRIRRVDASGTIGTLAGSSPAGGFGGDGGPATAALLSAPEGVAPGAGEALLIADTGNNRVREVAADGTIRTVAGGSVPADVGDGGLAAAALLDTPRAIAAIGERIVVADTGNDRLRQIAPTPTTPEPPPDPPPDPQGDPAPDPPPGVEPPVAGRRTAAGVVRGTIRVRLPGRRRFAALDAAVALPVGTVVDARRGAVAVFFATDDAGTGALAVASRGRFVIRQPDRLDRGQRPGVLALAGRLRGCARTRRGADRRSATPLASAAANRRRKGKRRRRLKVRAEGRVKTSGRYGSAIVRGTAWRIVDRCAGPRPGTLVAVSDGVVAVTDRVRQRTVRVAAGERYLARAPRRP